MERAGDLPSTSDEIGEIIVAEVDGDIVAGLSPPAATRVHA